MPERLFFHRLALIKSRSKGFYVINLAITVETTANWKGANNNKCHFQLNLAVRSWRANDEMEESDQYVCI